MLRYENPEVQEAFDRNLADWYRGGPHQDGWTRTGPEIAPRTKVVITSVQCQDINVEDAMAKNKDELLKWHVDLLRKKGGVESLYFQEYIIPRNGRGMGSIKNFLALFDSIRNEYDEQHPIWVADITPLGLGFQYFRFDGAHRLACAYVLRRHFLPALVFKTEEAP